MIVEKMEIIEQVEIASNIFKVTMYGESVGFMTSPGQFVHIKVEDGIDPTLRRPISIYDVDVEEKVLTLVYRVEGKGTNILSKKQVGDKLDVLGPLGNGFPIDQIKPGDTCLLVGGGIGSPPLYYLAKQIVAKGAKVVTILGFRSEKEVILDDEFSQLGKVYLTTEDGSKGSKGYVTDALLKVDDYDVYYSCGAKPMLLSVEEKARTAGYISLEERMGCGVGACLACVCDLKEPDKVTGKTYAKICSDGPVFLGGEVVIK